MSATAAQIEANRANAQRSTGPKTEEGKLASSANATREGLTSSRVIVRAGEQERFDAFQANLETELNPEGEFQRHYFDVIVHAAWGIIRCLAVEAEIQNEADAKNIFDAMLDDELSRKLDRVYRYKKMHESSQRKAVAELRRIQTEVSYRQLAHPEVQDERVLADTIQIDAAVRRAASQPRRVSSPIADDQCDDMPANIAAMIDPPKEWGADAYRRYLDSLKNKTAA